MKKTGLEIVEMIAKGKAPKKIKTYFNGDIYNFNEERCNYTNGNSNIELLVNLETKFEIIEEPKVWKPKYDEEYLVIGYDGDIYKSQWVDSNRDDKKLYELGNCFKTKEEAQKALEKIKIYVRLKRYAEEHNTEKIDWNNPGQAKFYMSYDYDKYDENKITEYQASAIKDIGQVYFTSKRLCKKAIKEIGEDNIMKLFED